MHISNNMSISGADAVRGATKAAAPSQVQSPEVTEFASVPDQLELSPEALAVEGDSTAETFRAGRVAELRAAIADGNYDTDELFEKAIQKMIDRLA